MKQPLQITFRGFPSSSDLEADIRARVAHLETTLPDLVSCRVMMTAERVEQHKSGAFSVHVDATFPQHDAHASRSVPHDCTHAEIHTAITHAFHAVERQLKEHHERAVSHR